MAVTIAVIGNCQAGSLTRCLRGLLPDADVNAINIERVRREPDCAEMAEQARRADIVVSQDLGPALGDLCTERLRAECSNLLLFPKIIFTGFHPDCTSLVADRRSVRSPTGAYHSVLAINAFLAGWPAARALGLFNAQTYEQLGYFDEFAKSESFLVSTAGALGYDLAAEVAEWMKAGAFMYSFNHPKLRVMASIARQAVARLGLSAGPLRLDLIKDGLGQASVWPVYPEIAARLGLDEPMVFPMAATVGGEALPLEAFVERSFAIYAGLPRSALEPRNRKLVQDLIAATA